MDSTRVLRAFLVLVSFGFFVWSCSRISPNSTFYPISSLAYLPISAKNGSQQERQQKLLCLILTQDTQDNKLKKLAVQNTWGRRCDKLIFVQNGTQLALVDQQQLLTVPIGCESRQKLWPKIFKAFQVVYGNSSQFDWFLKADDDTYVIVENLKSFLSNYSPQEPVYFGHKFKPFVRQGYMSGGAGYVLSRRALERLVEKGLRKNATECHLDVGSIEDVEMGLCLESVGVQAGDSRDSQGRPRFLPLTPSELISSSTNLKSDYWYNKYQFYAPAKWGKQCCSQETISFHYISPDMMRFIDWIVYDLKRSPPLVG